MRVRAKVPLFYLAVRTPNDEPFDIPEDRFDPRVMEPVAETGVEAGPKPEPEPEPEVEAEVRAMAAALAVANANAAVEARRRAAQNPSPAGPRRRGQGLGA